MLNKLKLGVKRFINEIGNYKIDIVKPIVSEVVKKQENPFNKEENIKADPIKTIHTNQADLFSKFTNLITSQKLKDNELILLHYADSHLQCIKFILSKFSRTLIA